VHAQIWAELQAKGEMIGAHDSWIAATALAHGMTLATANAKEFERVPALELLAIG
jgi:tRNA(fMet)-specific endonuclease VapC